jgi:hypothetical protein
MKSRPSTGLVLVGSELSAQPAAAAMPGAESEQNIATATLKTSVETPLVGAMGCKRFKIPAVIFPSHFRLLVEQVSVSSTIWQSGFPG